MPLPFSLQVPVDARFRELAPEIAGRFAQQLGGTRADGQALSTALTEAIDRLARETDATATLNIQFQQGATGVEITVRCDGRSTVVRHALPAPKG